MLMLISWDGQLLLQSYCQNKFSTKSSAEFCRFQLYQNIFKFLKYYVFRNGVIPVQQVKIEAWSANVNFDMSTTARSDHAIFRATLTATKNSSSCKQKLKTEFYFTQPFQYRTISWDERFNDYCVLRVHYNRILMI